MGGALQNLEGLYPTRIDDTSMLSLHDFFRPIARDLTLYFKRISR